MPTYLYSMSRKKEKEIVRGVTVESVGAEGKAVARIDGKVVFVSNAVPGDVIDVRIDKRREKYMEGTLVGIQTPSPDRLQPFCEHYQDCGGCAWQELPYHAAQVQAAAGRGPFLPHQASGQFLQNQKQDGRIVPQPTAKLHLQYSR